MADSFVPAMFGPPDLEGFRTVSFYGGEGSEILRLSLHIERFRQHFTRTADLKEYSDAEQEGLSTASVIAAARKQSSLHDPDLVLAGILDLLIPKFVIEQTEKHFPTLAWIALQTVGDACMVAFKTADAALRFALAFRQRTGDPLIAIRVGIHVGPVRIWEGDIYGLVVNYAARLAHIKVPGDEGIFLSATAKEHIQSEFGTNRQDFNLSRLAPTQLQGFGPREEVWQVITRELRVARAARLKAKQEDEATKEPEACRPSSS